MTAVYAQGASVDTTGLNPVAPKDVQPGREYIWEYWCPAITFSFINASTMDQFVKGLVNLDNVIASVAPTVGPSPVSITGVEIDTFTGNIWVRGVVRQTPANTDIAQAGVNPLAVLAVIGAVFAVIGAAVSLRYVYDLTAGRSSGSGSLDPCSNPGVWNYIDCLAQESKWFFFGALFGVVALVVFLLIRFGPKGVRA